MNLLDFLDASEGAELVVDKFLEEEILHQHFIHSIRPLFPFSLQLKIF